MNIYNKFIVSLIMAFINLAQDYYNVDLGIDEDVVSAALDFLWAFLVYFVPNGKAFWKWRS